MPDSCEASFLSLLSDSWCTGGRGSLNSQKSSSLALSVLMEENHSHKKRILALSALLWTRGTVGLMKAPQTVPCTRKSCLSGHSKMLWMLAWRQRGGKEMEKPGEKTVRIAGQRARAGCGARWPQRHTWVHSPAACCHMSSASPSPKFNNCLTTLPLWLNGTK